MAKYGRTEVYLNLMVGGTGFEPVTSAMSTLPCKYKRLTKTGFEQLTQEYISDRINTRGLTASSLVTIRGHFNQILRSFPKSFPTERELTIWLGQKSPGIRRRLFETLRAFGRWLERKKIMPDPWANIEVAKVPVPLLPAPEPEQVNQLFEYIDSHYPQESALRNKAIIATLIESSLRLSELASIKLENIDWQERTIKVWGKGQKEKKAPFGSVSESFLKEWLKIYQPQNGNIWGISRNGIQVMLKRLKTATGIPCNAHAFRRAFACILLKSGIDNLMIKRLGGWSDPRMVDRYTRSVTFQDSLKFYKAPLS